MIALIESLAGRWLRHWRVITIGVLAGLVCLQTYRIASLKAEQAGYVAKAEKARADAATRVIAVEREGARISFETEKTHDKAIADLRAAAARRLRALTGRAAAVPGVSDAAFQPDADTGGDRLCIETPNAVSLMLAADENTRQLLDLQGWVRKQEKAFP